MMMKLDGNERIVSFASELDEQTIEQAKKLASLSIIYDHIALMPDAHVGIGATVGSVIATENAIIPSAVGVDIGCGMVAIKTSAKVNELPDSLERMLRQIEKAIPAGVGSKHRAAKDAAGEFLTKNKPATELSESMMTKAITQLGTLGSGNHFLELCYDQDEFCWIVLHSGSRGIGKELAEIHISRAKALKNKLDESLLDPDLAYFLQGTPEFDQYISDMLWAQKYAALNREIMAESAMEVFKKMVPSANEVTRINCHHNFARREKVGNIELWITRKGAISARDSELGIVPGSMGTETFIVKGKGNPLSWYSSAHGAGRRLSRTAARKSISPDSLKKRMGSITWLEKRAKDLVDESPDAYKDIHQIIKDEQELVEVVSVLKPVLNYKGT